MCILPREDNCEHQFQIQDLLRYRRRARLPCPPEMGETSNDREMYFMETQTFFSNLMDNVLRIFNKLAHPQDVDNLLVTLEADVITKSTNEIFQYYLCFPLRYNISLFQSSEINSEKIRRWYQYPLLFIQFPTGSQLSRLLNLE